MHSIELFYSLSLNLLTTAQIYTSICSSLMLLSSIKGCTVVIFYFYLLWKRIIQSSIFICTLSTHLLFIRPCYDRTFLLTDLARIADIGCYFPWLLLVCPAWLQLWWTRDGRQNGSIAYLADHAWLHGGGNGLGIFMKGVDSLGGNVALMVGLSRVAEVGPVEGLCKAHLADICLAICCVRQCSIQAH